MQNNSEINSLFLAWVKLVVDFFLFLVFLLVTSGNVTTASINISGRCFSWTYSFIYYFVFTLGNGYIKLFFSKMKNKKTKHKTFKY